MKKIALAAALSVTASSAFAGGMAQPMMEAPLVAAPAAATSSSGSGLIVPLLLLLVLAAAVANT